MLHNCKSMNLTNANIYALHNSKHLHLFVFSLYVTVLHKQVVLISQSTAKYQPQSRV
jgi:hypothetical protein